MLIAPEQFAVEDETGDAEDTDLVGLLDRSLMIALPFTHVIRLERRRIAARLRDSRRDRKKQASQTSRRCRDSLSPLFCRCN